MAKTTVSIEIPASADAVWQLMGGFDALPDWLPFIPKSVVTEGGRVRSLTTSDGGTVVERLEAFDNRQRSYTYSIIQAPFPVVDYLSTITVHETADERRGRSAVYRHLSGWSQGAEGQLCCLMRSTGVGTSGV